MWMDGSSWDGGGSDDLLDHAHTTGAPQAPSRSAVQGALLAIGDLLMDVDGVDAALTTKLRAMKNYADTMFDQHDYMTLKGVLSESPDLVDALQQRSLPRALAELEQRTDGGDALRQALGYANDLDAKLSEDERAALWEEVQLLCDLAH